MWMNESEINRAIEQFQSHPVLGKGARFLGTLRDEVNAHSDGWPYWQAPAKAADKLMTLLQSHLFAGMGAYPRLAEPTEADLNKAIAPIKAFYKRAGYKAGLKFPSLEDDSFIQSQVKRNAAGPAGRKFRSRMDENALNPDDKNLYEREEQATEDSEEPTAAEGVEFDLHVWAKPETENMTALYTISNGKRSVCFDLPLDLALEHVREEIERVTTHQN